MEAPDKIYINVTPLGVDYSIVPIPNFGGVEYIRKDAMLEWAKNLKERWEEPPMSKHSPGCVFMLEQLIDRLNSM